MPIAASPSDCSNAGKASPSTFTGRNSEVALSPYAASAAWALSLLPAALFSSPPDAPRAMPAAITITTTTPATIAHTGTEPDDSGFCVYPGMAGRPLSLGRLLMGTSWGRW